MEEAKKVRCFGEPEDPLMMSYHDREWGVPVHDDHLMFEFLTLEGAQAGLSWQTILRKRENYRKAFDNFDPVKVAAYTDEDRPRLLTDAGIVRNRAKIDATINNANRVLEVQREFGGFDHYIWQFTGRSGLITFESLPARDTTIRRSGLITFESLPAQSPESKAMSRDLRKRGFRFVGPTICYAYMQAVGMVNDHITACFRAPK